MAYKAAGKCSECGERLVYPEGHEKAGLPKPAGTKTCSAAHRNQRARRIKRAQASAAKSSPYAPEHQDLAAAVRGETQDVAHEVMVEELRPVVREAMTADVLGGIDSLIKLTPRAIQLLEEQMESSDETIAQRAVTLLLKYTMGNPSVAPPPAQQAPAPMSVTFNIPRPGDTTPESSATGDAEELRQCTDCSQHKSESEFVGSSSRCQECFEKLQATLEERFAKDDPTAP